MLGLKDGFRGGILYCQGRSHTRYGNARKRRALPSTVFDPLLRGTLAYARSPFKE
jgi:hypothetical protein